MILPAAHKQGFPRWPWRWPFIWSPWSMVLTPDMLILHCMSSRWSIYPGEEWIFSNLDSGFQSLVGFRILSAGFRIPKPRIPDSTSKNSGFRRKNKGMWTVYYRVIAIIFTGKLFIWSQNLNTNQLCYWTREKYTVVIALSRFQQTWESTRFPSIYRSFSKVFTAELRCCSMA